MDINKKSLELGSKRSIIREIFEYSKQRATEIGAENVFDFSLGNPSVEPPKEVNDSISELLNGENQTILHGYTSAQGDLSVRKTIAESIKNRFNVKNINENNIYMTCGAAASLSISLNAIVNDGDECIVFAPFFTEYRVFVQNARGELIVSNPNPVTLQLDLDDFKSKITAKTKAIILNSPNNPSGVVYTEDVIVGLCNILNQLQSYI